MDLGSSLGGAVKLTGKRVLIVEDEALVSMLIEDELLNEGAKIVGPAATIYDALRLIDEAQVDGALDAAVLDLDLGGEFAIPVADKLRASGIPFLIATGYGETCDTGGHRAAPVLAKPFHPDALVAAVAAMVAPGRQH